MKPTSDNTGEPQPSLRLATGSALYRCTGCGVTGTWDDWISSFDRTKHECDVCANEGAGGKLVPVLPNVSDQPRGPSENGVSDSGQFIEDGRLPALRCGGWFGSGFIASARQSFA